MEEVLETFADNIASMVIAASQEDAAFTNIVQGATSMKRAVTAMAAGARKTAQSPAVQPDAKAVIEATATELEDAGTALLVHATAARDAMSKDVKIAEQRETVKVAKDILQKVVLVVMLEDQLNIQLLTDSARHVNDITERINGLTAPDQFALILPEASAIHQDFLRRAARRIALCKEGSEPRADLERAVEQVKAATPRHLLAAQSKFTNPTPASDDELRQAGRAVDDAVDLVLEIVRDIFERNAQYIGAAFAFRAPTTSREERLRVQAVTMDECAAALVPTLVAGGDVQTALREFLGSTNELLTAARATALECSDPVRRAVIEKTSEELQELLPRIVELAKYCAEHPEDAAARAELQALTEHARELGAVLYTATRDETPAAVLAANARAVDDAQARMHKAVLAGDDAAAEAELAALDAHLARQQAIMEAMLETEPDPQRREALRLAVDDIKARRPLLAAAMRRYLRDPKSVQNQKDLTDALGRMKTACDLLTPPHVVVAACNHAYARKIEQLAAVADARKPNFQTDAILHVKAAAAQFQAMKQHAAACQDLCQSKERRAEIEAAVARTQLLTGRLVEATKAFIVAPTAESTAQLRAAANNARAAGDELARRVQPTAEEAAAFRTVMKLAMGVLAPPAAAEPEHEPVPASVALVVEPAPEPAAAPVAHFDIEGPRNERIYAAAVQVEENVPAAQPDAATTPQGRLLKTTHDIAELMAKLSAFAAVGDKKGMIDTSRAIAAHIKDITKQAHVIGTACTDPRLRDDVRNNSLASENHAVQLKIMSAVKAASDESDDTAEDQLVTAATGLASSVVKTANACQSASVHKSVRQAGINEQKTP